MVLGLHFLRRMKSRADWDRLYGRWPYMTIWCTGGSKFSVSYFPLPTTQLHHQYYSIVLPLLHLQGWRIVPLSIARLTPRHRHLPHGQRIVPLTICVNHYTPHAAPPVDPKARVCFRTSLMDLC